MKLETMISEVVTRKMEKEQEARELAAQAERWRREEAMIRFREKITRDMGEAFLESAQGDWYSHARTGTPMYMFYYQHHLVTFDYEAYNATGLGITVENTKDEHGEPRSGFVPQAHHQAMLENTLLKIHELTSDE